VIAYIFLSPLLHLITEIIGIRDPLISLVFFQSTINLGTLVICFPFLSPFARWLENKFGNDTTNLSLHLKKLLLNEPEEGITAIRKETRRLLVNIVDLNMEALEISPAGNESPFRKDELISMPKGQSYSEHYEIVKHLNGEIIDFCIELKKNDQEGAEREQLELLLSVLRHTMSAAKSIKDIRHNIKNYRDSENDKLHAFFKQFQENELAFYGAFIEILYSDWSSGSVSNLQESAIENKNRFHLHLSSLFHLNGNERLDDLEMATLINVFTAINDSHQFLTQATLELYGHTEVVPV
jgi:phosphate:Na+ symporter